MKHIKLYENFDFEEVWEEEPPLDLTKIILGKDGPDFNVLDKVISKTIGKSFNKIGYVIDYYPNKVTISGEVIISSRTYLIYFIDDISNTSGRYLNIPEGHGMWISSNKLKKIE